MLKLTTMLLLVFLAFSLSTAAIIPNVGNLPEVNMNVTQLIEYNGYPAEQYDVTTEDGYIINIQRIPHGRQGRFKEVTNKPVVFLQHGLLGSATNWVTNPSNESFGFVLADNGFDVWLGNVRGNTYGLHHVNLSVHSDAFWDFSWDEMAKYDLPAMLNFVLKKTQQPSLYYAGHSQGTLIAFAEFSRNLDLTKKVKAFFAMAPVTTVAHMKSPIRYFTYFMPEIESLFKILGVRDFLPSDELTRWLANEVCAKEFIDTFCSDIIFIVAGFDKAQLNETRLPVYVSHMPAGTSVKNLVHFGQLYRSKKFQMYDYRTAAKNREHYGQATPPQYNATAMNVPVAVYWGEKDWLSVPTDVKILLQQLPNQMYNKYIPQWDHLDFIWGMDAATVVYNDIIAHIKRSHFLEKRHMKIN